MNYSAPVNKLLSFGDCRNFEKWPNYLELELTEKHVAELIQMAIDKDLHHTNMDELSAWAPIHAWRALAQLKARRAIKPLLNLFEELIDDDWADDELPTVFAMIGPAALPSLANYLSEVDHGESPLILAANCVAEIGLKNSGVQEKSISILTERLKKFEDNSPGINSFLIWFLTDLKAIGSMDTIREAYHRECVDLTIVGDLTFVEYKLGLTDKPPQVQLFAVESPNEEKPFPFSADST